MTMMDERDLCSECAEPGAAIELASGEGLVCARCFARRLALGGARDDVETRGVRWSRAERAKWRETAALAGQPAIAAQCVSDALAARGVTYREAGAWVWEHAAAYADIYVACGPTMRRVDDSATSVPRTDVTSSDAELADEVRSRSPRPPVTERG